MGAVGGAGGSALPPSGHTFTGLSDSAKQKRRQGLPTAALGRGKALGLEHSNPALGECWGHRNRWGGPQLIPLPQLDGDGVF